MSVWRRRTVCVPHYRAEPGHYAEQGGSCYAVTGVADSALSTSAPSIAPQVPATVAVAVYAVNAVAHVVLLLHLTPELQDTTVSVPQQLGSQAQPPVQHLLHHLVGTPYGGEAACVAARAALIGVGVTALLGLLHTRRRQGAV